MPSLITREEIYLPHELWEEFTKGVYVYTIPPIDWFPMETHVWQWIKDAPENDEDGEFHGVSTAAERVAILIELAHLLSKVTDWEGDVRPHEVHICPILEPSSCGTAFVFKQDNDGTTFVVSSTALPHLEKDCFVAPVFIPVPKKQAMPRNLVRRVLDAKKEG